MLKQEKLIVAAFLTVFAASSVSAYAATQPPPKAAPQGWATQGTQGTQGGQRQGDRSGMRELAVARSEVNRYILGISALEKDKNLAITKAQAKALKPVATTIKNSNLLDQSGMRMQNLRDPKTGKIDEAKRDKLMKAMENSGKIAANCVAKIESILNAKQLGAIDGMEFQDLRFGGFGGGRGGNGQNQGQGQSFGNRGNGANGGGGGSWGGQRFTPEQMQKMRKQMEEQQKKMTEKLQKGLTDLIKLIDKKSK